MTIFPRKILETQFVSPMESLGEINVLSAWENLETQMNLRVSGLGMMITVLDVNYLSVF